MAEVELIIKVSEELYNRFRHEYSDENLISKYTNDAILDAFCNGTPLPKGHGRLIDYGYVVDAIDDWINAGEYNYTNATGYLRKRVANTPTIIEADKARMQIVIDIPKEFEEHFNKDRFEDSLRRLSADAHLLAGNYEQETAIMLINAFKNGTPILK